MKICVIGTGYVGLVSGLCFAEFGFKTICVDKDTDKLDHNKLMEWLCNDQTSLNYIPENTLNINDVDLCFPSYFIQ